MRVLVGVLCLLGGGSTITQASPLQWSTGVGGNGHYYEYVPADSIDHTDAKAAAESLSHLGNPGYLATVTSQAENDFISGSLTWADSAWLGAWQEPNMSPLDGWHWDTGEPWVFTNWGAGEPNDWLGVDENFAMMWGYLRVTGLGQWYDKWDESIFWTDGYLVEYVPEPATIGLLALGGLAVLKRKQ